MIAVLSNGIRSTIIWNTLDCFSALLFIFSLSRFMDRGKRKGEMDRGKRGSQNKSKKRKPNGKEDGLWFDLKEAKKEVRKFGIAGMTGTEKKSATINMLIGLGAKVTFLYC